MIKFIKKMIEKHPSLWEIFKFVLIGGIATLIDFLAMSVVLYIWDPAIYENNFLKVFYGGGDPSSLAAIIATGIGFSVSLIFNYIFSVIFVFSGKNNSTQKAKTQKGFVLFAVFALIGLAIHVLGMYLGYDVLKINEWIVKISLTLIVLVFNYITRKKFIFNKKESGQIERDTKIIE